MQMLRYRFEMKGRRRILPELSQNFVCFLSLGHKIATKDSEVCPPEKSVKQTSHTPKCDDIFTMRK